MNNLVEGESVFLDTTFLAAFSISEHKNFPKAQKLLATLLVGNYKLHTSLLCIHELFAVVRRTCNSNHGNFPLIRKLNTVLRKVNLRILFNEKNFSYKQVHKDLQNSVGAIQQGGFIKLLDLNSSHIPMSLDAIKRFDSKPGDSFHFSVMDNYSIKTIITENSKDFQRMNFKVIWF